MYTLHKRHRSLQCKMHYVSQKVEDNQNSLLHACTCTHTHTHTHAHFEGHIPGYPELFYWFPWICFCVHSRRVRSLAANCCWQLLWCCVAGERAHERNAGSLSSLNTVQSQTLQKRKRDEDGLVTVSCSILLTTMLELLSYHHFLGLWHIASSRSLLPVCLCVFLCILCIEINISGLSRLLECPGFLFLKFSGPGKSWKMSFVLETPGN